MTSFFEVTEEELIDILKSYIGDKSQLELNNFKEIINRAEVNEEWNDVKFSLAFFNLYLNLEDLTYKDAEPKQPAWVIE